MPQFKFNPIQVSNPNIGANFQAGQKLRDQFDLTRKNKKIDELSGLAAGGDQAASQELSGLDPQRAEQVFESIGANSQAQRETAARDAFQIGNAPIEQQTAMIEARIAEVEGRGGDATDSRELLAMPPEQRAEVLKVIQRAALTNEQRLAAPKSTTLQSNLTAAGLVPGSDEFKAAVLKSIDKPSTQINVGGKGDEAFAKEFAKGQAKAFARIQEEADAAIDTNQSLDVLENIDVTTGALEPAKQALAAYGKAFGLDTSNIANVSAAEGFNAEAKRLVLAVKASQKGPQTDKDEATIRQTVANLGNTKEGNKFIINSARALNNRRIERKDFYDNFIEGNDGNYRNKQGQTADSAWSKFKRNTPMVSKSLRTTEGLPVFFYKFEQEVRNANPDATKAEILEAWRTADKGKK